MGRYSSWWSRLLIIGVIAAVITPVGIYAVPQLEPYLNMVALSEHPENVVLKEMVFVDSDVNEQNEWTWVLTRLDTEFTNHLDVDMRIPRASLSIRYLSGILGTGYIPEEVDIFANTTMTVPIYMRISNVGSQGVLFSHFLRAMFWGQPFTLSADLDVYILIDGAINEPLLGMKLPITMALPMPLDLEGWDPFIHEIERGVANDDQVVTINVKTSDIGAGISRNNSIYYREVGQTTWQKSDFQDQAWQNIYKQIPLGADYPIASSDPENPITITGTIPGFPDDTEIEYYIYIEDWAGNWEHKKQANYVKSEIYSYTVGPSSTQETITLDIAYIEPFVISFLKAIENRGVSLLHLMYQKGMSMLEVTPLMGVMSNTFYNYDVDINYFIVYLMTDFYRGVLVAADSGCPAGLLFEMLGDEFHFTFDSLISYILPRAWYPFPGDDIVATALNALYNYDPDLEYYFENDLGISANDMIAYLTPAAQYIFTTDSDEYRSAYTLNVTIPITILGITFDFSIRTSGAIIKDWTYNSGISPYENWLNLIITGDETNGHWQAASLILKSSYCTKQLAGVQEEFMKLLQSEILAIPNEFPANDLYPYTHQLISLSLLLVLGIVSYLVLKREVLIHRKVERGIAAKKKMKQKAIFEKDSKNKAQSKYL